MDELFAFKWFLGVSGAIVSSAAILWAKEIHGHLKSIDSTIQSIRVLEGRVEEFMAHTDKNMERIEHKLARLEEKIAG